ncbi:MAG: tetratricopeptide repeat protein [Bacteroidales bacterium]|jgi:Tfp pilus assembly protein PilF|nr:tetratricopeptide repeat protein [Bacteroidales bacterium]HPB02407.1 tetratricopeptide repeat protein [Bacteroidales bacterium]
MRIKYLIFSIIALALSSAMISCGNKNDQNVQQSQDSALSPLEILNMKIEENPKADSLYQQRAELFLSMGETEKALSDVRQALQLNPEKTDYHILLGDVYLAMGNIESCRKSLMKAFDMDPGNPEPSLKLAELNLFLEDYEKVFLYSNKAIDIDKYNAKAHFIKGFALLEQKDTAKAIVSLQKATENDPEYYDAFIMLGHVFDLKEDPIAGNYLKTAVRIRPTSAEARYNYGLWLQEQQMIEDALVQYDALLVIEPKNKNAWYNIGYINLVYLENFNTAIEKFTKSIECDPVYAEAWYNRGLAYEELQDYKNARENYSQALKLKHNYENAIVALNRIEGK